MRKYNKEKIRTYEKEYRKTPQRIGYMKKWRQEHRDKIRDYFRKWSNVKNSNLINSEINEGYYGSSGLGKKYEKIAQSILNGSTLENKRHSPYDLSWNGSTIEVKMRNKNKNGNYSFRCNKKGNADYFLCFCVDESIKYILLIPKEIYGSSISLSENNIITKYKKYIFIIKEQ